MKKPLKDMPCMAEFTRMVNEDTSNNDYNIESLDGHYAQLKRSFSSDQLRVVADAMDELKAAIDLLLPSSEYFKNDHQEALVFAKHEKLIRTAKECGLKIPNQEKKK